MTEYQIVKPCPFCGGRAEQSNPDAPHGGMVHCVSCGAEAFGPKWNSRVSLPSLQEIAEKDARIERLEAENGRLKSEIERFKSERLYIIGFNDGYSACEGNSNA